MAFAGGAALAGLIAVSWTALLLAEIGSFTPWPPLALGVAAAAGFLRAARGRSHRDSPRAARIAVGGVALAVLAAAVPPGEHLLGGWDPGVYLHTAAGIVRHRSLRFSETDLAALTREEQGIITRDLEGIQEPFPGMRLLPDGRVTPQFHHLYPALMAVAYALGGIWAALLVNPLLTAAATYAVHALARRLVPSPWPVVAPLAFAFSPAVIWQSKFSTAEVLAGVLLMGGSVLLIDTLRHDAVPGHVPVLAGLAFGGAFLARYDALLFLSPLIVLLLSQCRDPVRRRQVLPVLVPVAALGLQAWLHGRVVAPYYAPLGTTVFKGLGAVAIAAAVLLVAPATPAGRRLGAALRERASGGRRSAAALFALWVVFSWLVRPRLQAAAGLPEGLGFLAGAGSMDFLYLEDLLGPAGLALGSAGIAVLILRCRDRGAAVWLLPSLAVMVVLTSNVFHDRFLMWVARRFTPVVMPLLCVGTAAAAAWIAERAGRRGEIAGRAVAALAVVLALLPLLPAAGAMARLRDWPGLAAWQRSVAGAIPERALLYCDQPGFAGSLRFLSGIRAYEFHHQDPVRREAFGALLAGRADRGARVMLLTRNAPPPLEGRGWVEAGRFPLNSSIIETPRRGVPLAPRPRKDVLVLYELRAVADP